MRDAFRYAASLLALAVVVQVGLAGYGAFDAADAAGAAAGANDPYRPHMALGYAIVTLMVLVVLLAAAGAREALRLSAIVLVLGIVQAALVPAADAASWVGFLHGANALAIAALAGALAARAWRGRRPPSTV